MALISEQQNQKFDRWGIARWAASTKKALIHEIT